MPGMEAHKKKSPKKSGGTRRASKIRPELSIFFLHQPLPTLIMRPEDRRGCSLRAERPLARAKTSNGQDAGAGSCFFWGGG